MLEKAALRSQPPTRLPPTTAQTQQVNQAWKRILFDIYTEHLRQDSLQPSSTPQTTQLPSSDTLRVLDTDQLWQTLEFRNKALLPATRRRLRRLVPHQKRNQSPSADGHEPDHDIRNTTSVDNSNDEMGSTSLISSGDQQDPNIEAKRTGDSNAESDDEAGLFEKAAKQRRLIEAIEERNLAPKSWSLRGEVSASTRPKNSLLESTFEYDTLGKPNVLATGDWNSEIEDMIKRRIADSRFDDVVPAEVARPSKEEKDVDDKLSEKPQKGLAELYEEEFREVNREKDVVDSEMLSGRDKEAQEIATAFEAVSRKLDALCHMGAPVIEEFGKSGAEAVPEDLVKDEGIVSIEGNHASGGKRRKKKRRKG